MKDKVTKTRRNRKTCKYNHLGGTYFACQLKFYDTKLCPFCSSGDVQLVVPETKFYKCNECGWEWIN